MTCYSSFNPLFVVTFITTFDTIKLHEQKQESEARKSERKSRRARRDKAHAIRVDRFQKRTALERID